MPIVQIETPLPPLNLYETVRIEIGDTWTKIYDVPQYLIPAVGPEPARTVEACALVTGLIISNTDAGVSIEVDLSIFDADDTTENPLVKARPIPANDYVLFALDKQFMKSGEKLYAKVTNLQTAHAHMSFVLNQRTEFEVIE